MEIVSLIVSIISMIGTIISAVAAFMAKSEVNKIKANQKIKGNNNKQSIRGINNGR